MIAEMPQVLAWQSNVRTWLTVLLSESATWQDSAMRARLLTVGDVRNAKVGQYRSVHRPLLLPRTFTTLTCRSSAISFFSLLAFLSRSSRRYR
jgi:hypothetical protein